MSKHRHIVSKHLLRSRAREKRHEILEMQRRACEHVPNAKALLIARKIGVSDHLSVERAGRIRARWQVVASK